MTTPKSPDEIINVWMNNLQEYFTAIQTSKTVDPRDLTKKGANILYDGTVKAIRSSMSSLLCYMAERMQSQPGDDYGYTTGIEKAESILIEEARKISEV